MQNQAVLGVERALESGSAALDLAVDQRIEHCKAHAEPTVESRKACIEDLARTNEIAEETITVAVAAMRAYWTAVAADDKDLKTRSFATLVEAVRNLPPDYFKGLQKLLKDR